ncbi:hypothetical protein [Halalkalibacter nanhaiisediminis]|uniref:Uncharacterized protein n=1 Tax=Halalkalibacter nanhaiisediminis TaxID=688079 RepID=A0A562QM33_9BACI|nr:hypothetical protein [Halalkalibacter nanhaiisediminis]TWI57807.1 hypothetical protein IQ10_01135 [Halalkalibacter nanhaiisediminis]
MLDLAILILFSIAILLFVLSFFRKDRTADIEKQLENISIRYMQEMYQLKKKIRLLEEELLINHQSSAFLKQSKSSSKQQLLKEIVERYEQGDDIEEIAEATELTIDEVQGLLLPYLQAEKEEGR